LNQQDNQKTAKFMFWV